MKYIAIDIETIGLKPYGGVIWMISISRLVGKNIKTELLEDCNGIRSIPASLKKELEDDQICKVIHNGVFDIPYLQLMFGIRIQNVWDSENMEVLIQGVRYSTNKKNILAGSFEEAMLTEHSSRLDYVLPRYGFPKPNKDIRKNFIDRPLGKPFTKEEKDYAVGDTKYLLPIQKAQEYILKRDGLWELALMENLNTERLSGMRTIGIGFDSKIWNKIAEDNEKEFNKRTNKLPKEVSNWNSERQVKKYFKDRGILIDSYDDLDAIAISSGDKVLKDFIAARELHKAVTSYGKNFFENGFVDADNRIRCDVTQTINTGRMSMSNPNLQQLPAGGQHRAAFVPKKGHVFVIGDFSGQEIGIMAAASEEKIWIEAMLRGEDVHSLTASIIEANAWAEGTTKSCTFPKKCECPKHIALRTPAKINNFMLAYGGGPTKLAEKTGMDNLTARMYVGSHKRAVPKLTRYLDKCGKNAMDTGVAYSASPFKRRRVLRAQESWQIRNQGMNTPIQAAGADMLKLAMVSVPLQFDIVLVIHDEIILEVPKAAANKAAKMLKEVMEKSAAYVTGIKGLISVKPKIAMNLLKHD
jgi:DNA polymerase I-like protein with 3'-5' exonuclease and polymerase domains